MIPYFTLKKAALIVRAGGVIAYPTEGVFGLGCLPDDEDAVARLLGIKMRDADKGLILIAGNAEQLDPWVVLPRGRSIPVSSPEKPVTWIVPAADITPGWLTGGRSTVAVRLTGFDDTAALCVAADSALISTSANISGRQPARNTYVLRRQFCGLVDYIVPGRCGPATGPSEIRDLESGEILRPGA